MSDLSTENQAEVERLVQPANSEAQILEDNKLRKDALKQKKYIEAGQAAKEEALPKLSAADFKVYNGMAEQMDYYHNHFRQSWKMIYTACVNNKRPSSMGLRQFINTGLQFCSQITMHHGIEEQYLYPILARKMPEFREGQHSSELLRQHKEIHRGLDKFEEYLKKCLEGETELDLRILKAQMETWSDVLWKHLDQEVESLGAKHMRKYWTLEEMRRMPM